MNLLNILKPQRTNFLTGIPEFDTHIDFGANQIISLCTDESMLSTQLLHFLAMKSANQNRHTFFIDVSGNLDQRIYGVPDFLLERITYLDIGDTYNLAQTVGELGDSPLILIDGFNAISHEQNQDKYVSAAMRILSALRDNKATVVLEEFTNGITNKAPTAKFPEVYYRIFLNSRDAFAPKYRFSFEITKCGRGIPEPITLSKFDFEIPQKSDYHKYFVQRYP